MDSFFTFLFLLATHSGAHAWIQLIQSGPGAVKPGETLTLTCTDLGQSITSGHGWHWVRQPPGKGLEWLGWRYYCSSTWYTNYGSSFQSRITISPDSSKNRFSLQLASLGAADTTTYYCTREAVVFICSIIINGGVFSGQCIQQEIILISGRVPRYE
ncbi:unnamed protein product [Caretta caretta]